jgi:hypothetical protein
MDIVYMLKTLLLALGLSLAPVVVMLIARAGLLSQFGKFEWIIVAGWVAIVFVSIFLDIAGSNQGAFRIVDIAADLATALGLVLLGYQIHHQRAERTAQTVAQAFAETKKSEVLEALHFVFCRKSADLVRSKLSERELQKVENLTRLYNKWGYLIRKGVLPRDKLLDLIWNLVVKSGQRLVPHIQEGRHLREEDLPQLAKYRGYYAWLVKECKLHHLELIDQPVSQDERDKWKESISLEELQELLDREPLTIYDDERVETVQ